MIVRVETRTYQARPGAAEPDAGGARTKRTALANCPFCGAAVKIYLWSLAGGGKLCTCGAKFQSGGSCVKAIDTGVSVTETAASKPGRPEYEITAPDGYNFEGPHSLVVRDTMRVASAEARSARIVRCSPGCDCGFDDGASRG